MLRRAVETSCGGRIPCVQDRPASIIQNRPQRSQTPLVGPQQSRQNMPARLAASVQPSATATAPCASSTSASQQDRTLLCVAVTASQTTEALRQVRQATEAGADSVELRLDFLEDFDAGSTLELLLGSCALPAVVTCRAGWEG